MCVSRPTGVGAISREGFVELEHHAGREPLRNAGMRPVKPDDVVSFWQQAGMERWFTKDADFDARFRETFLHAYELARSGRLDCWSATPNGALALLILLDQFPRNSFRGTSRMYESDSLALMLAKRAIEAGHDRQLIPALRSFLYMPLCHSEGLADQERAVALFRPLGERPARAAERHCDIIRRFGRFPHRNRILGRAMTAEEQR
ncbi:DUF924 family protein, partial [Bradyrhizobium sp. STM 3843]|uniref:DUF924 family protein n=1 Tax=Bradyrhizobium sp. STM 3843 TaxID=551947 RepID=UPI001FCB0D04